MLDGRLILNVIIELNCELYHRMPYAGNSPGPFAALLCLAADPCRCGVGPRAARSRIHGQGRIEWAWAHVGTLGRADGLLF